MKISDLTGDWLDYWVAKAEGHEVDPPLTPGQPWPQREELGRKYEPNCCRFSTDWQFGGPLIERERICILQYDDVPGYAVAHIGADVAGGAIVDSRAFAEGPTVLVAAMRAFLISKFGEAVPEKV